MPSLSCWQLFARRAPKPKMRRRLRKASSWSRPFCKSTIPGGARKSSRWWKKRPHRRADKGNAGRPASALRAVAPCSGGQSLTCFEDIAFTVRFRHEGAATNTSPGIERAPGCINHRHARPNGAETFGNVPAAGIAAKIDVGEYDI